MMWLDILALIIIFAFALNGARTGGTAQILRVGAALVAMLLAPLCSRHLVGPIGATFTELPALAISGLAIISAAILLYLIFALITYFVTEVIIKASAILTAADRAVGFGLGMLKALLVLFIIGHGLLALRPSMPEESMDGSVYLGIVDTVKIRDIIDATGITNSVL